ncbi:hypothetical protein ACH4U7_16350 [Streptomyces sp. NPDC020845]|uniref:hypothetical protein n=1 Tax=Streptomyces sp. NPDC020845 TaxID=3365096 RepID=UPI00378C4484
MPAAVGRSPVKGWLAVLAVTLGIFSLMTSELLPVGLLTPVGSALHVSEGTAGLMVTVPGLVACGIALRLVPEKHVPRATAVIFGGVETASVLGVPPGRSSATSATGAPRSPPWTSSG